jgi:hypothetical protein
MHQRGEVPDTKRSSRPDAGRTSLLLSLFVIVIQDLMPAVPYIKKGTQKKERTHPRTIKTGSMPRKEENHTERGRCAIRTDPIRLMPKHMAKAKGTAVPVVIRQRYLRLPGSAYFSPRAMTHFEKGSPRAMTISRT